MKVPFTLCLRRIKLPVRKRTWAQKSLTIPCPADKRKYLLLLVPTQGGGMEIFYVIYTFGERL